MKTFRHLFTVLLLLCATVSTAHDFEVDGIYYNITDATNKTVEVTFKGTYYDSYSNEYEGSVIIPESVTHDSNTYRVTSIGNDAFYNCDSLTDVYYTGSESEWKALSIESGNSPLTNATIHYNYVPEN